MGVPSVTASSSAMVDHVVKPALAEVAQLVFTKRGNLYGFLVENNGAADCFIQFFDATAAVDVTVGTTVPDFTFRVPASGAMGKDVNDSPLHFFAKGCVVAVTATRTGNGAPAAPSTAQFWSYNSKY